MSKFIKVTVNENKLSKVVLNIGSIAYLEQLEEGGCKIHLNSGDNLTSKLSMVDFGEILDDAYQV